MIFPPQRCKKGKEFTGMIMDQYERCSTHCTIIKLTSFSLKLKKITYDKTYENDFWMNPPGRSLAMPANR
jgi:hypothetical protein